jgi:hypothetical protein
MMKKSILKVFVVLALLAMTLGATLLPTFAAAYSTYTYSIDGTQLASPDAYVPDAHYDSDKTGITLYSTHQLPLQEPCELTVDSDGNIYIIDKIILKIDEKTSENIYRIIVLDPYFKFMYDLYEFTSESGALNTFNKPSGLCITEDYIYVADTDNERIVVFNRVDGGRSVPTFHKIIPRPQADIFGENNLYKPVAVASDDNHVYVVSSTTNMGIISMDIDGNFQGFIGAQKVNANALAIIWRMFQTDEQRILQTKFVSTEYNNIVMDDAGFIYVTTSSIDPALQQKAINDKSTSAEYAPVKKLNTNGDDILNRSGFYPPSGEVLVSNKVRTGGPPTGASTIIDVAIGPEETWSIIDQKRQRIFTYDKNGNLLFAFGDKGLQLGNLKGIKAICYQNYNGLNNMVVLDDKTDSITTYSRTEYGDLIVAALRNDNLRNYEKAVDDYQNILERNLNFDAAYIGKAKALYRAGDYNSAMEEYSFAYNTSGYSQAFKMYRKDWVSKYIIVVPIVAVVVCVGIYFFFKYAGKVNAKTAITSGKRTFKQELLFAFHLMFHPFDGFWDLKHEKRGSLRGAAFYIGLAVLSFTYQSVGRSYMYNPRGTYSSIAMQFASVCIPVALFAAANWCITTLFDGEGSIKDIVIATGYSLAPLPLLIIPATLLTHILSSSESGIITLLNSFAFIWLGLLLFFGIMITHDYPMVKNFVTVIVTIVGMAFIMFLIILFATLVSDMFGLVSNIITEISYRM